MSEATTAVVVEIAAAASGRLDQTALAQVLEPLDLTKFLTSDGKVDTEKVKTYVNGVAPAKGNERKGSTTNGQGNRTNSATPEESVQDRAAARLERLGVKVTP
jgi:hypothetical protein